MDLPNVTLRTSAKVTHILTNPTGTAVTGVEVELEDSAGGHKSSATFTGDIVVLSCGADQLRRAASASAPATATPTGLANSSDMVGRNFMYPQLQRDGRPLGQENHTST